MRRFFREHVCHQLERAALYAFRAERDRRAGLYVRRKGLERGAKVLGRGDKEDRVAIGKVRHVGGGGHGGNGCGRQEGGVAAAAGERGCDLWLSRPDPNVAPCRARANGERRAPGAGPCDTDSLESRFGLSYIC